jgi:2-polyprenyl-6-hydroxyphenyl methylase / 3-demethylubiquinone-9 3-methyltransferase
MPVNNQVYSSRPDAWWDEDHYLHLLKTGVNPARFAYFHDILRRLQLSPKALSILDVGSGGGFLSEEFARLGCRVSGIDPAHASVRAARDHALGEDLSIAYLTGRGEGLPFPQCCFDVVLCCDVLEHVDDLEQVAAELARVTKPGGLFFFDTINRTFKSWLANIFVAQQFPLTRFFDPDVHVWDKFIRPDELVPLLRRHGLEDIRLSGLTPSLPDPAVAFWLVLRKFGLLNLAELGRKLKFRTGGGLETNYIGWGRKRAA